MYYLPETTRFGQIEMVSEYMRYDVPRIFLAKSKKLDKNKFIFVNWVEEKPDYDGWYYIEISSDEKLRIESGDNQIRDLYQFKEIWSIKTPFDRSQSVDEQALKPEDVNSMALPPNGFGLAESDEGFELVKKSVSEFKTTASNHEVRFYKPRGSNLLSWGLIEKSLGDWARLCNSIMNDVDKFFLSPSVASPGSFRMQFNTVENEVLISRMIEINDCINDASTCVDMLRSNGVDTRVMEKFLSSLAEAELQCDLRTNAGGDVVTFNFKTLKATIAALSDFNQRQVSSEFIPQANELDRVIKYVVCKAKQHTFNAISEDITERQILYYTTAAKILGLVDSQYLITPSGRKLAEFETAKERINFIAERFEVTECGWAWMKYADVDSVYSLTPDTAAPFLIQFARGLSEDTARRRSSTLVKWLTQFKEAR